MFENGKITYRNNLEMLYDTSGELPIMSHRYDVSEPSPYFIVSNKKGDISLMIRYKKTGIRKVSTILINDNGELCYRESENPFTKIK